MTNMHLICVVSAAFYACLAGEAAAGPAEDVLMGVQKCAGIADDKARLACYDGLVPKANTTASHPAAPPSPQLLEQKFGSEEVPAPQSNEERETPASEIDSITATLADYAFTPTGRFIVFLDNGEVWRQIEGDTDHARFKKDAKDNKVTISRALFGSYDMTIEGSNRIFKVLRVK